MESVKVSFPNGKSFNAPILDPKNRAHLTPIELLDVSYYLIDRIREKGSLAQLEILPPRTPYVQDSEVAETKPIPFRRDASVFAVELLGAIERIALEFGNNQLLTYDGEGWLEVDYSDGKGFADYQNLWGDFGYIFARVLRKS